MLANAEYQNMQHLYDWSRKNGPVPVQVETLARTIIVSARGALSELQMEEDRIKERKRVLLGFVKRAEIILSPIRTIPIEILTQIFFHCLPIKHNPVLDPASTPMTLTHVSKLWRELALRLPRLWNRFHLVLDYKGSRIISKEWIRRAGKRVPFFLSLSPLPTSRECDTCFLITEILTLVSDRIRELVIYGLPSYQPYLCKMSAQLKLPELETLSVYLNWKFDEEAEDFVRDWTFWRSPLFSFGFVPKVRQLVIPRLIIRENNAYSNLGNLTHFFLSVHPETWVTGNNPSFTVLRSMPLLQQLSIEIYMRPEDTAGMLLSPNFDMESEVNLPELTVLRLSLYSPRGYGVAEMGSLNVSASRALRRLSFPNLKHLFYSVLGPSNHAYDDSLHTILSKNDISLETLQLNTLYSPLHTSFQDFFRMPSLTNLSRLRMPWESICELTSSLCLSTLTPQENPTAELDWGFTVSVLPPTLTEVEIVITDAYDFFDKHLPLIHVQANHCLPELKRLSLFLTYGEADAPIAVPAEPDESQYTTSLVLPPPPCDGDGRWDFGIPSCMQLKHEPHHRQSWFFEELDTFMARPPEEWLTRED